MLWKAWMKDNKKDLAEATFKTMHDGLVGVFEKMHPVATRRWEMCKTAQKHRQAGAGLRDGRF